MKPAALLAITLLAAFAGPSDATAPYAGQKSREIKALSPEDVEGYLAGKGMGLAKAAELNGYPGPSHVLELSRQLGLSQEQEARTRALFDSMLASASRLGRELVDRERALDNLFATRAADPGQLAAILAEIGSLQAQLRGAHLEAHLAQVQILSPAQVAEYSKLRGYGAPAPAGAGGHHRHH